MRGQDREQRSKEAVRASTSGTIGEQLPRTSASPTVASPALGIRPRLTLTVAGVFALVAIAAIVGLTWHASTARRNDERLDEVIVDFNRLQAMPWGLQAARINGGGPTDAALRADAAAIERRITRRLAALERAAPTQGLLAVRAPLARNFAALTAMFNVISSGNPTGWGIAAPAVFDNADAVQAALNQARSDYGSVADVTLWEATIGSIVVILLLLGGFIVFYWRSVTARKNAEALAAELDLSREHLEHAQRIAGIGSWEWDDRDRIVRWSREQARLHGWIGPEPPPSPGAFLKLVAQDDRPRVARAMHRAFREGRTIELEYRVAESRGGRLLHVHATNTVEADGRRHLVGTSQDMTERFRRAEAERANRTKNEFISRMSHELRTPLNAVLGFGQLMSMSDLDERQRGNVDHILSAGRHLLDLINEILDISRLESGDVRLSLEPVSLPGVLLDTVDLITPLASEHHISVTVDEEPDLWVHADVQRLRQVLLNLLSNAVKYNADGGHVWVRTSRQAGDGRVRIDVRDDGHGIAPEMMERLFSPFERLGAEQSAVEGTGLGLAVSRGMIEAMGGRISVRSQRGSGSTFTIELPAASAPVATTAPSAPAVADGTTVRLAPAARRQHGAPEPRTPAHPFTLLCIEDNAANVELVEQILTDRPGVRLLTAADGRIGLRVAEAESPDLVLLDLDLPDMTGENVLRELQRNPATAQIPVVILSAATAEEQTERLLELGARSYISKPPGVTALLQAVDAAAAPESAAVEVPDHARSVA